MGIVGSIIRRKVQGFNIENRAHRFLERDKPVPAPKYESNLEDWKRAMKMDPEGIEKLNLKDAALDSRLKSVYVTSEDSVIDYAAQRRNDPNKPLPLERNAPEYFEFGYKEPTRLSRGHCTLRQALQFISDHQADPEHWTSKKIAEDYKMKEEEVAKILKYFKPFNMFVPDKKAEDTLLTQAKTKLIDSKDENNPT